MDEALAEAVQVQKFRQKAGALDARVQQLEAELQRSLPLESPSKAVKSQSMWINGKHEELV